MSTTTEIRKAFLTGLAITGLMAFVHFLSWSLQVNIVQLGIFPKRVTGLVGLVCAPFIHANLLHLFSNIFPLLLLLFGLFLFYKKIAAEVLLWLVLLTGFWTWLFARQNLHIGASGLVYALAGFLFFSGLVRKDKTSVYLSIAVWVLHSGLLYGIFPTDPHISWESHLSGMVAGLVTAILHRNTVQLPVNPAAEPKQNYVPELDVPWHLTAPEVWVEDEQLKAWFEEKEARRLADLPKQLPETHLTAPFSYRYTFVPKPTQGQEKP